MGAGCNQGRALYSASPAIYIPLSPLHLFHLAPQSDTAAFDLRLTILLWTFIVAVQSPRNSSLALPSTLSAGMRNQTR